MMFSSPAVRVFSAENADVTAKKPGASTTRQPLFDRGVNNSPAINKNLKGASPKVEPRIAPKLVPEADEDLFFYDIYSFQDVEDERQDLSSEDILRILRSYCGYKGAKTPPPTPPSKFAPDFDMFINVPEDRVLFDNEDVHEVDVPDVELPAIDFDDSM